MIHPMQTSGVNISVTLSFPDKSETCFLLFHGGRIAPAPKARVAPNGIWIVQPKHDVTMACNGRPTQAWPLAETTLKTDDDETAPRKPLVSHMGFMSAFSSTHR